ncbi:hypothetical protein [Helicobacter fennelliae]|uniref:hypothetical protein n=1 Tax=Helicobacter fennelliae TaxID=215 RepID=UPI000E0FA7F8|nr:hypothetical protein [Helicobacter fennelliae]
MCHCVCIDSTRIYVVFVVIARLPLGSRGNPFLTRLLRPIVLAMTNLPPQLRAKFSNFAWQSIF